MLEHPDEEVNSPDYTELIEFGTLRTAALVRLRNQIAMLPARSEQTPMRLGWYDDLTNWIDTDCDCVSEPEEPINWDDLIFDPDETPAMTAHELGAA